MGYTKAAITGFGWLGGLKVFVEILSVGKIVVLSRILSPKDFGVFSITIAVLSLVERVTETGINTFLVQKKDSLEKYVNAAWVISLIRGALISLVIFVSSSILAHFYNEPVLTSYLMIASVIPLIKGCINPAIVTFWKNMHYNKDALYRGVITAAESLGSIALAFYLHSPLGLIYALLISAVLEVLLSHLLVSPRPRFQAKKSVIVEILHSSKWLNLSVIFSFLVGTIDNLIIGKVLGTEKLGYYQNAYAVTNSTTGDLGDLGAQIVFPIYAKIQDDKKRLKRALLRASIMMGGLALLPPIVVMINPTWAVSLVLGEKWLPIVPLLPILFIAMYIRAMNAVMYPLYLAVEKAYINVIILGIQVFVLVCAIIPLSLSHDLMGASWAVVLSYLMIQPLFAYFITTSLRKK